MSSKGGTPSIISASARRLVVLVELAGAVIFGMATRRLSGWWSITLPWLAILIFLSFASASDWVGDVVRFPIWQMPESNEAVQRTRLPTGR